ncbi:hypothetical protein, partial [Obesumbacterium proteus]
MAIVGIEGVLQQLQAT